MGIQALYSAASGMTALQTKLDVIANNLSNMETTGFKEDRANFEDLLYQQEKLPGAQDSSGLYTPTGIAVGAGHRGSRARRPTSPRARCSRPAATGHGHPGQRLLPGDRSQRHRSYYTRAGNFSKNANGDIVMGSASMGRLLQPKITIPTDTTAVVDQLRKGSSRSNSPTTSS